MTCVVPEKVLSNVKSLYEQGLYVQAHAAGCAHAPLKDWRGTHARVLAGALAMSLGAPRLGRGVLFQAWRNDRTNSEAAFYYARLLMEYFGPWSAWKFLTRQKEFSEAPPESSADWLSSHAYVLACLRDFDAAAEWIKRAEQVAPSRSWLFAERAHILRMEDRYDAALEAARHALTLRPWYRPAVEACAHILELVGKESEALELLAEAGNRLECANLHAHLARLQTELGMYREARQNYERYIELAPLLEAHGKAWAHARLSDASYYCGSISDALTHARQATGSPFHAAIAERLAAHAGENGNGSNSNGTSKRTLLPVGFVRQHHMTCAPATLTAIAKFWSLPANHLEVAEAICYDGTPAYGERNWATSNGWIAREFTVTWENAVALIDRRVPFTLTTQEATSGHLQAVIGYDTLRGTLLVRDPYTRHFCEFYAERMFEYHKSTGPRGMTMVPADRAELLDGIELKDAVLYDKVHAVNSALERHDRPAAWEAYTTLAASDPEHRLTFQARRSIAGYDGDFTSLLAATEEALKLFPADPSLLLGKLNCLRHLGRHDDRMALLDRLCKRLLEEQSDGRAVTPRFDPMFWAYYAQELYTDAREHGKTLDLLKKCVRCRPSEARGYHLMANVLWRRGAFDTALELYRFAACLHGSDEAYARSYFVASRHFNAQNRSLALIENRFKRHGKKSGYPACTLHWALDLLERRADGSKALDEALALRPDDGELLLYAAETFGRYGERQRASTLLNNASGKSRRSAWMRTAAVLARYDGQLEEARKLWLGVLEIEPLAIDAHREAAVLLAETTGRVAALEHLRTYCERFPFNFAIHQLRAEWLRDEPAQAEAVLRHLASIDTSNAWTRREWASVLTQLKNFDEAEREAELARALEPHNPTTFNILGNLRLARQDREGAKREYRAAIALDVDVTFAIDKLFDLCESPDETRAELKFLYSELVRQTTFGDGLLAYRSHAHRYVEPAALLKVLEEGLAARPDLWHTWSAIVHELVDSNRLDEALAKAREATARFPLVYQAWLELARVCHARSDADGRLAAFSKAVEVEPTNGYAARELAGAYEERGQFKEARKILEQAVARRPLDAYNHGCLAGIQWKMGERSAALEHLRTALRLEPDYSWGWSTLDDWADILKQPKLAIEIARELATKRPGETRSWLILARLLWREEDVNDRFAALKNVIVLDPHCGEAYDLKAQALANCKRYEEALAACAPAALGAHIPIALRGRAAWVEAERNNLDAAIEKMLPLLVELPKYSWGWGQLASWRNEKGDAALYLETAENMVRALPQASNAYGHRGKARLQAKNEREGAKQDYAHALELQPDYAYAGLNLFDLHLEDGGLDAAASVIDRLAQHLPSDPYVLARQLRLAARKQDPARAQNLWQELCDRTPDQDWPLKSGFEALKEAGCNTQALGVLRKALEKTPDWYHGWKALADFCPEKENADYLKAAREMVRIRPDNAIAQGYLGHALRREKDIDGAIVAFLRALEMDETYGYAGRNVFDLLLERARVVDAEKVLEKLKKHHPDEYTKLREVDLAIKQRLNNAALDRFRELCMMNGAERSTIQYVVDELKKANLRESARRILDECIDRAKSHVCCAEFWVNLTPKERVSEVAWRLKKMDATSPCLCPLLSGYITLLAQLRRRRTIWNVIRAYETPLRADTFTWGKIGYALYLARDYKGVTAWLSSYKERKDVKPWMLANLALAQRILGRNQEAYAINEYALTLPYEDASRKHAIWMAADEIQNGEYEKGAARIEKIDRDKLDTYSRFIHVLISAHVAVARAPLEKRRAQFNHSMNELLRARAQYSPGNLKWFWSDRVLRRIYCRTIWQMGELRCIWWARPSAALQIFSTAIGAT